VYYTPVSLKFMENFVLLDAALIAVCEVMLVVFAQGGRGEADGGKL
jgi:hypothetical protein